MFQPTTLNEQIESHKKIVRERVQRLEAIEARMDLFPLAEPDSKADTEPLRYPEKVTVKWLINNVPVQVWIALVSLLLTAFMLGISVGQTTFVQEIIEGDSRVEQVKGSESQK